MRQSGLTAKCFLGLALVLALGGAPAAEADEFTLGLKAWSAALSANNLAGDNDLFPGLYFAWDVNDRLWISAGYVEGEADFTVTGSTTSGSIEEVDSDLIVGWSFAKLDVGVGYRFAEFTTVLDPAVPVTSTGPMVYLGGGNFFGQYRWGYYWGMAYMFKDMDDDDGAQEHINGEVGIRWTSRKNLSILFGYRHKEYSGEGAAGATFSGPVMNLAYTWR